MKQDPSTILDTNSDPVLHKAEPVPLPKIKLPVNIPKYHWKPDRLDTRDYKYQLSNAAQQNLVDLRPYCTPIENQGSLGSCTGQSIAGAIELLHKKKNKNIDVSRLFIYYYERALIGTVNYDSGAYIRDGIKVTNKQGAPIESLWPYDITKFKIKPNEPANTDAARRKVTLYERVTNHNGCLDAITNGYPVVIGFMVYSSFESTQVSKFGIMPYPNTGRERFLGGHAVLLVGYDKKKQVYIARNSWGAGWGDKGYFYMPFKVIQTQSMSSDFWVIKSVNMP